MSGERGKGNSRVDDHDLSFLAMRTRRAVQEHRVSACHRHVEGADLGLPVLEGDVAAVHAGVHGRACLVYGRLRDGVVAVAELELHNVAYCGDDGVWHESVLGPANDDGDDLAGTAVGIEPGQCGDSSRQGKEKAGGLHDGDCVDRGRSD